MMRQSPRPYSAIDTLADASLRTIEICVDHLSLKSPTSAPTTPLPPFKDVFYQRLWSEGDALLSATAAPSPYDVSMPELALESGIQQKKAVGKKPTRRSLWKCQRRPLSMQDLLCAEPRQLYRARSDRASHRRQCGVTDCFKYALSGGFCISHGGGKPCRHEGCATVAQSGGLCKAHGGGSKCKTAGCSSVARRKGFCMTHGGRQPCKIDGCGKCAHGGGLCIAHGGGKRCSSANCTKSAQAGGFCYSHGGGKRCSAPQCFQAARKGGRCIRHREDESASE